MWVQGRGAVAFSTGRWVRFAKSFFFGCGAKAAASEGSSAAACVVFSIGWWVRFAKSFFFGCEARSAASSGAGSEETGPVLRVSVGSFILELLEAVEGSGDLAIEGDFEAEQGS